MRTDLLVRRGSGWSGLFLLSVLVAWGAVGCRGPADSESPRGEGQGSAQPIAAHEPLPAPPVEPPEAASDAESPDEPPAQPAATEPLAAPAGAAKITAAGASTARPAVADPPAGDSRPEADDSGPAAGGSRSATHKVKVSAEPPAPVREPLFEGWPEPELVLFITGRQHGYIEPCGCSGLTNQKGGLVRRWTLRQQLVDRGWNVVPVDVGDQVRRYGRQAEIKFQMTIEGLRQMGYQAIGFGPDDLRLSVGELVALTASDGQHATPFVCANMAILDRSLTPTFQILESGGRKIGVTAVLGAEEQAKITSDEILKESPLEALKAVWPTLEQAGCDLYVLLAHTSIEDSIRLAQEVPHFDVVVTAGGAGEPTYEPESIPGTDSILVQVGTKGMHVGVVGMFAGSPRLRYQRVPLDARFPDSRAMLDLLGSYQEQLKVAGLEGLGVKPIPHPSELQYVGSDSCQDCHEDEYDIWENTSHSWALDSLVHPGERSEIPRHFDPECISCHVIGWNPQKYFPYVSGYLELEQTPLMHNVGCENCHGPGSAHNEAEVLNKDQALIEKLRLQMRLPLEEAEKKCMDCHDLDNSPDFHVPGAFERYWEEIEH